MEIDFGSYLSEDERKEIVADTFRQMCMNEFKKDSERIFSNAAYQVVYKIVDEQFEGNVSNIIAEKSVSLIKNLSSYSVFRSNDYWNKESPAHKALNEAIEKNKQAVIDRVSEIISEFDSSDLREIILDTANEFIYDQLFKRGSK